MAHILYINDNNLVLQGSSSVVRSQGYAWLKGDQVLFDVGDNVSPVAHCRLAPQEINSRYWQQCEQSAITANGAGMRHAADLLWKHLTALKERHDIADLLLVVPSHYQSANLRLLLGIAKSVGISVVGLVNKAAFSLHDKLQADGDFLHLDVQLHQTVCSKIQVDQGIARLGDVEVIQSVGIQAMQDALLKMAQAHFIQNDRFDPLHYAETEQQLFDQLAEVAKELKESGKALVKVKHQGQQHSTSIDSKLWESALEPYLQQLISSAHRSDQLFVDMNAAFDGVTPSALVNAVVIDGMSNANMKALTSDAETGDALVYRTELALQATKPSPVVAPQDNRSEAPQSTATESGAVSVGVREEPTGATHLLQSGIAVPIEHSELRTDNNQLSLHVSGKGNTQTMLDAKQIFIMNDDARRQLKPNDRIGSHLADGVITVIQVV